MYKFLIISTAFMFIVAGGYYVNVAGGGIMGDIITGNITTQETLIPLVIEDIPGTYLCNTSSTCKNKYTLILKNDKTAELKRTTSLTATNVEGDDESNNENTLTSTEVGTWDIGVQNLLVVTLIQQEDTIYAIPQKIVIKNVKAKTLSKISYTKAHYKDMNNPIFIKQE